MPHAAGEPHKKLIEDGSNLFSKRASLDNFWQECAYQFYPEMAEFTHTRYLGDEYADHLSTSYPLIARRTLGDSLSALLRPVNLDSGSPGVWFGMQPEDERRKNTQSDRWLEHITSVQRRAMYDVKSGFTRATKEGDHSFATFGQCALSLTLNTQRDGLLYRHWHLKDVAWSEDGEGQICAIYRRWRPEAHQLEQVFRDKVSPKVKERAEKAPYTKCKCLHVMIKSDLYEQRDKNAKKFRQPWVSIWIDEEHNYVMEEIGSFSSHYIIPRWVTIPGSQYASSPAVTAALPDARLIQAMTLTMLESGEKYVDPPIIATQEAVRSDIQVFAGGTTWVDAEYDERLGDVLRPLYEPAAGQAMGIAFNMAAGTRDQISKAFFLDSLSLPPADVRDMTAFEVGQRISEWMRRAMPIFEPMEFEYNGAICEATFDLLLRNGAFGNLEDMPDSLRDSEIKFKFESPLHEGADRRKGQRFLEAKAALVQAAELDPVVAKMLDAETALRDVLSGTGAPADWVVDEFEMMKIRQAEEAAQQQQLALAGGTAGAEMAQKLGVAAKDFAQAEGTI